VFVLPPWIILGLDDERQSVQLGKIAIGRNFVTPLRPSTPHGAGEEFEERARAASLDDLVNLSGLFRVSLFPRNHYVHVPASGCESAKPAKTAE
jgi:hypothetical protein